MVTKLRDGLDLDAFFRKVAEASARTLLLDYDGTLAPFREERNRAVPYPGIREAVRDLIDDRSTRVVIVSGRALADLRPLLGIEPPPEMWGSHGWERFTTHGPVDRADPGADARTGLDRALEIARDRVDDERIEVKPVSVAVHTRGLDEAGTNEVEAAVRGPWQKIAEGSDLDLHAFDGGLELRVPGRDKGTAVRDILADDDGRGVVAYLGDDATDEDAFHALSDFGDRALRVLVRGEARESAADLWIRPPDELLDFLGRWRRSATS